MGIQYTLGLRLGMLREQGHDGQGNDLLDLLHQLLVLLLLLALLLPGVGQLTQPPALGEPPLRRWGPWESEGSSCRAAMKAISLGLYFFGHTPVGKVHLPG